MRVFPCKFCGAKGVRSNQGGIDGIPEWEVYVTHKDDCIVKYKGTVQDGVTWHPIEDWVNFYSGFPEQMRPRKNRKR